MRRFVAIARTAAIETMSQPLSAILFAVAALAIHVLPAFQYHRFGAPGRLARETGLSGLFIFGLLFAVPAIVRTIGRSLETGVAAATLALGVSRPMYFTAHLAGTLFVFAMFFVSVVSATSVSSFSCVKASTIHHPDRRWGRCPHMGPGIGRWSLRLHCPVRRSSACKSLSGWAVLPLDVHAHRGFPDRRVRHLP